MPTKSKLTTTVDDPALEWLRDAASEFHKPIGTVISDLVRLYGGELATVYQENRERLGIRGSGSETAAASDGG